MNKTKPETLIEEGNEKTIENYNPIRRPSKLCDLKTWQTNEKEIKTLVNITFQKNPKIRVSAHLTALVALTAWAEKENLGLTVKELLTRTHIDTFTSTLTKAQGTRRHQLNTIRAAINGTANVTNVKFHKKPLAAPYTEAEIVKYLNFAKSITNQNRKNRLLATIALGAGTGLVRGKQKSVCKNDIHEHSKRDLENTTLFLRYKNTCIPIHPLLTSTIQSLHDQMPLIGKGQGKNFLTQSANWIPATNGSKRLCLDQLRAFYVKWVLETPRPLKETLGILGLKTVSGLGGYLQYLDDQKDANDEHLDCCHKNQNQ